MIYTLEDGIEACKQWVDSGTNNTAKITARLNEAIQRLMTIASWKLLVRQYRIFTCNNHIGLPREIEKIVGFNIDGAPASVFGRFHECIESGPGRLTGHYNSPEKHLVDMGNNFPTLHSWRNDREYYILAVSQENDDFGQEIQLFGIDERNDQIHTDGIPGLTIPIMRWKDGVLGSMGPRSQWQYSRIPFKRLDYVIKPVTKGHVTLMAYNPSAVATAVDTTAPTDLMLQFLSRYHPDETKPNYRRYKIQGATCCNAIAALCKMAYYPAKHMTDVLLIQSMPALKNMIQAITLSNNGERKEAREAEMDAIRILQKELSNNEVSPPMVVSSTFGLGDIEALE